MLLIVWLTVTVVGTLLYATLVEYLVHRYLDHRPFKLFGWHPRLFVYLYESHSLTHHELYTSGESYIYNGKVEPMDWIDVPLFVWSHVSVAPVYIMVGSLLGWPCLLASFVYITFHELVLYSMIHYAMHNPRGSIWERLFFIRHLNLHHWLHHRHQHKNYAFTYPIFDYLFGTKWKGTAAERDEFERILRLRAAPRMEGFPRELSSRE